MVRWVIKFDILFCVTIVSEKNKLIMEIMVVQLLHISHVLNSQENTIVKESITVSTENYVKQDINCYLKELSC